LVKFNRTELEVGVSLLNVNAPGAELASKVRSSRDSISTTDGKNRHCPRGRRCVERSARNRRLRVLSQGERRMSESLLRCRKWDNTLENSLFRFGIRHRSRQKIENFRVDQRAGIALNDWRGRLRTPAPHVSDNKELAIHIQTRICILQRSSQYVSVLAKLRTGCPCGR